MQKKNIIMFDFDGVLVDSFKQCFAATKKYHPLLSENEYRKLFHGNIYETLTAHPSRGAPDREFFAEYMPRLLKCKQVRGVAAAVRVLSERHLLTIVSSTITAAIEDFLQRVGLERHFVDVLGCDIEKSKVKKIKFILDKYFIGAADSLFITDTLGDIREAEIMGVKSLAVTWGFHNQKTLLSGSPLALADKPADLVRLAKDYFQAKRGE